MSDRKTLLGPPPPRYIPTPPTPEQLGTATASSTTTSPTAFSRSLHEHMVRMPHLYDSPNQMISALVKTYANRKVITVAAAGVLQDQLRSLAALGEVAHDSLTPSLQLIAVDLKPKNRERDRKHLQAAALPLARAQQDGSCTDFDPQALVPSFVAALKALVKDPTEDVGVDTQALIDVFESALVQAMKPADVTRPVLVSKDGAKNKARGQRHAADVAAVKNEIEAENEKAGKTAQRKATGHDRRHSMPSSTRTTEAAAYAINATRQPSSRDSVGDSARDSPYQSDSQRSAKEPASSRPPGSRRPYKGEGKPVYPLQYSPPSLQEKIASASTATTASISTAVSVATTPSGSGKPGSHDTRVTGELDDFLRELEGSRKPVSVRADSTPASNPQASRPNEVPVMRQEVSTVTSKVSAMLSEVSVLLSEISPLQPQPGPFEATAVRAPTLASTDQSAFAFLIDALRRHREFFRTNLQAAESDYTTLLVVVGHLPDNVGLLDETLNQALPTALAAARSQLSEMHMTRLHILADACSKGLMTLGSSAESTALQRFIARIANVGREEIQKT